MRACDTAERHAATAELYSAYDPPESDRDRQRPDEAPLCLGHRRGLRNDLHDYLPRAVRHQHAGPPPSEPAGVRLELLRDLRRLCPPVAGLGARQPTGGLARGSVWGAPYHVPGGLLVHRGHGAHRQHDSPLGVLSVFRRPPGRPTDDLSGTSGGGGRHLVQDTHRSGDGHPTGRAGLGNGTGHSPGHCAVHPLRPGLDVLGSWSGRWCPPTLADTAVSQ
jgi:hypothetical protein